MPRAAEFAKVPAISSSPASGLSRPATQRKVVVLPQPLGPSRTQNSFSVTSRSIPRSASTRPRRLSNHFLSPRMLIKVKNPWSSGVMEYWAHHPTTPLLQHSSTPFRLSVSRAKLTAKPRKANLQYSNHQHSEKHQQHAQGSNLRHPAIAPELPDDGRDD